MTEMETTFNNVTITVSASTPQEAYNKLCGLLSACGVDWQTDTYHTDEKSGDTSDLFPKE